MVNITRTTQTGDETVESLSLGMDTLDEFFEEGGVRIGTIVNIVSDPTSLGEYVVANMVAKRPCYYYSLSRSEEHIVDNIVDVPNVDLDAVNIEEVSVDGGLDALMTSIRQTEFPTGVTIIIDPVNALEAQTQPRYQEFLRELDAVIDEVNGLAVLHSIQSESSPPNRWVSEYMADTVFEVTTEYMDEVLKNFILIRKAYPGQSRRNEYFRRFELQHKLDIDVTTTRNVSP